MTQEPTNQIILRLVQTLASLQSLQRKRIKCLMNGVMELERNAQSSKKREKRR
jgi:hypothetical protein